MTGGGADDTITPLVWPSDLDGLRVSQLYNSLTALDKTPATALLGRGSLRLQRHRVDGATSKGHYVSQR